MNKADEYFKELLQDIKQNGVWSKNPRSKWKDGTPAQYKSVYHKSYTFDLSKGDFPITTIRNTALRGCFEEIRWIYQLQSNIIEDAHPCIHGWWKDFVVNNFSERQYANHYELGEFFWLNSDPKNRISDIGKTYGYIIKKYDLMNKLLHDLEHNSDSRRKMMSLWDNQCQKEDSKALPPCAYQTNWIVRTKIEDYVGNYSDIIDADKDTLKYVTGISMAVKYIDLTLFQRSRDCIPVFSINPTEYTMLLMMVCGHLTYKTGVLHKPGILTHHVEDEHIYDRNIWALDELLEREPTRLQPKIELICEPKDFYDYRWEDFKITGLEGITKLSNKLEIAI